MSIFDAITNVKNKLVSASYYSSTKMSEMFGLSPIKQTDTPKEVGLKSVKNVIAEATTLITGKVVSKIPINAKTITTGAVVGTATAGYIASSDNPFKTTKSLVSNVGTAIPKTSSAIFDLGSTLKQSRDTMSVSPILEYGKEHPLASGTLLASTAYLGGKSISSGINLLTAEKLDTKIKDATTSITNISQSPINSFNPNQEDIEEEITKREINLAEISAKTREKELESQTKIREKELETQEYIAKQTAQQSISTPPVTAVPVTKKKTTKKKTTKKKAKKKPVKKKKSKKTSKSKNKR